MRLFLSLIFIDLTVIRPATPSGSGGLRVRGLQTPSEGPQRTSDSLRSASGPQGALEASGVPGGFSVLKRPHLVFKGLRKLKKASGNLRRLKRRLSEGPEGLGRPERT